MEIGIRLSATLIIMMLTAIQVGAWALGFDGQVTVGITTTIVALCGIAFGLKVAAKIK